MIGYLPVVSDLEISVMWPWNYKAPVKPEYSGGLLILSRDWAQVT